MQDLDLSKRVGSVREIVLRDAKYRLEGFEVEVEVGPNDGGDCGANSYLCFSVETGPDLLEDLAKHGVVPSFVLGVIESQLTHTVMDGAIRGQPVQGPGHQCLGHNCKEQPQQIYARMIRVLEDCVEPAEKGGCRAARGLQPGGVHCLANEVVTHLRVSCFVRIDSQCRLSALFGKGREPVTTPNQKQRIVDRAKLEVGREIEVGEEVVNQ